MDAWDHHKTLTEFSTWAERQMRDALDDLRKRLLDEAPEEARDAVQGLMGTLDSVGSDEWDSLMHPVLKDAEPDEEAIGASENPRREHGTYLTSNGRRAA